MEFIPLHTVPKHFEECAEVLNEEWKRSLSARLHSLKKSCDTFPICLVLLEKNKSDDFSVVGHSRLSHVQGQANKSCLVESVVVRKSHRGKGFGRIVMERTEKFAASKGYKTMYLTTHDKQDFYKHLGYEFCSPVVCFDSSVVPDHLAQKLLGSLTLTRKIDNRVPHSEMEEVKTEKVTNSNNGGIRTEEDSDLFQCTQTSKSSTDQCNNPSLNQNSSASIPPAPPPPPAAPMPPPAAPPPPPTPSCTTPSKKVGSSDEKTVTRWDPKLVSWMKKTLSEREIES